MDILDFFPEGMTPRVNQAAALKQIQLEYARNDVICVVSPTGSGKSPMTLTVANWLQALGVSSNIIAPTNPLVEQMLEMYPHLQALHRKDTYQCKDWGTCKDGYKQQKHYCKGCPYTKALRDTKKAKIRLMNYYTYWAQKMYADTLIVDEAHLLLNMLQDKKDLVLWHSQYNFPTGMKVVSDVVRWIEGKLKRGPDARLEAVLFELIRYNRSQAVEYTEAEYRNKADIALKVYPVSSRDVPPWLWPQNKVRKIILFSATLSLEDVKDLGLDRRRVKFIHCGSPIPVERRQVIYEPHVAMSMRTAEYCVPRLCERIQRLLEGNPEKGLIHTPYSLVPELTSLLKSDRLMFHTRDNKQEVLQQFRDSNPAEGKILVASGLYEGIDLPYDKARWQVICKVPFLSLGSVRIRAKMEHRPDWYDWCALKLLIQASGRISRAADDFGTTYIFDRNFGRLVEKDEKRQAPLIPHYFKAAIVNK